jgi:lysophospholipase L1-like esterase
VIINLDGVYDAYPVDAIRLAEWDEHPNALGHRLIAERLYQEIQAKRASIFP